MIEFKAYDSKPVIRWAFQITDQHDFAKIGEAKYMIMEKTQHTTNMIRFKAHEEVKVGDWVVKLTESDTYHCTDAVFRERNIITN
jgi:hypothetical protein